MNLSDLLQPDGGGAKRQPIATTDQATTKPKKTVTPLEKNQQAFLKEIRSLLPRRIKLHLEENQKILDQYERLVNHTQRGTWDSFHELLVALESLSTFPRRGAIVLGGWHRKPDLSKISAPPSDLTVNIYSLAIHGEMLKRIKEDSSHKSVWSFANQFRHVFSPSLEDDCWKIGRLESLAQEQVAKLVPLIHEHLLFMEDTAFIFHPTPENPAEGWEDLFRFKWGYGFLPLKIRAAFRSHYLIIQKPSASMDLSEKLPDPDEEPDISQYT